MASRSPTPVDGVTQQADDPAIQTPAAVVGGAQAPAETGEAQPDESPETSEEQTVAEDRSIPARILVDFQHFKANTFALLTEAEAAMCHGWADLEEAAVEFVESLAD